MLAMLSSAYSSIRPAAALTGEPSAITTRASVCTASWVAGAHPLAACPASCMVEVASLAQEGTNLVVAAAAAEAVRYNVLNMCYYDIHDVVFCFSGLAGSLFMVQSSCSLGGRGPATC